jgi:hypothetical protein
MEDGDTLDVPAGAYPELKGHFVCTGPTGLIILDEPTSCAAGPMGPRPSLTNPDPAPTTRGRDQSVPRVLRRGRRRGARIPVQCRTSTTGPSTP